MDVKTENTPQDTDITTLLDSVTKVSAKIDGMQTEHTKSIDDLRAKQESINKTLSERQDSIQRELAALQQRATAPAVHAEGAKSIGDQFVSHKGFAEFMKTARDNKRADFRLELAANPVTTQAGNTATRTTLGAPAELGLVTDPRAILNIESLFPHITINTSSYQYIKMVRATTLTATGPAITPEGAAKPESNYTGTIQTGTIKTMATWIKMTEQMMADDANIVTFINDDLRQQLSEKVEAEIVNGNGSGELLGMTATGNYTDYTSEAGLASGDTVIDLVIKYKSAMEAANIRGLTLLLNPADWVKVLTAKNANKDYLIPGILDIPAQRLWGTPVVLNSNVPSGKFIMGNFTQAAKVIERTNLAVEMDRTEDDFIKNLMTLRLERRLDFAVTQPKAITFGDFAPVS